MSKDPFTLRALFPGVAYKVVSQCGTEIGDVWQIANDGNYQCLVTAPSGAGSCTAIAASPESAARLAYAGLKINTKDLTDDQRRIRGHIRNFLLVASPEELEAEKKIHLEMGDHFGAQCIQELIDEYQEA